MRYLFLLLFTCFSVGLKAQASSLVLNDDVFLVIDNSAFVVVENSTPAGVTQTGAGGRIVSESEGDKLRWMIGNGTGTYTVPFSTALGVEFPFSINITGAGAGSGNITFSTYPGASWDNNTYRPTDVTHMFDYATGSVNNSSHVIDRFWIIDPLSYTTKPSATFSITYIDAEHTPAGNTIVESNLGAQRFNTGSGIWGDYLPQGTVNTATNVVSAIPVTAANFFRSWTLSETTSPLPITLLGFNASCQDKYVNITWSTASESNIERFSIWGSHDGVDFTELKSVYPIGSTGINNYEVQVTGSYNYYTLKSHEINGGEKTEAVKHLNCGETNGASAYVSNGTVTVNLSLGQADAINFSLFDAAGKLIGNNSMPLAEGNSTLQLNNFSMAQGIYFLRISSPLNNINTTIKLFK